MTTTTPLVDVGRLDAMFSAILSLLQARWYAEDVQVDVWQFAVSIEIFRECETPDGYLCWLVQKRYLEKALEVTSQDDSERKFAPLKNPHLPARTCFVCTELGARELCQLIALGTPARVTPRARVPGNQSQEGENTSETLNSESPKEQLPVWDSNLRELRFGRDLVKRFRVPAPNQELILNVFEEEGWPPCIDDPLPPTKTDSKRRLQATLKSLNRHQACQVIRFVGNGNGHVIRWEHTP